MALDALEIYRTSSWNWYCLPGEHALNPELSCIGGILSLAGDFLMPVIEKEVEQRALKWNREAMKLVLAAHAADACVMGGVAAVYQAILAQPDIVGALVA